ncbi:hypothetical protein BDW22DRAFT_1406600 [Trametopsis cervina]|nr:hypothetical protein BDW22DRAFT_1406600 [Trametopsis cervina]
MDDEETPLVMRRSRRSTAGNRMEAALAEFKAEELGQDAEEDADFTMALDEQDAFESDFESTDDEVGAEDVDMTAEKTVREEDKRAKKTARSHLDKITAAAHARQKATFNPETASPKVPAAKLNRRVSLGGAVDAETGAVLEGRKRKSLRRHTMLNTSMTEIRAKDELEKKSAVPRKMKVKTRAPTQDELIARALDMEDGNIKEHRNYLKIEEEKRQRARVVRTAVEGPLIRWISKAEEVKVLVQPPSQPIAPFQAPPASFPHYGYPYQPAPGTPPVNPSYPVYTPPPTSSYQPIASQPSSSQMTFVNYSYAQPSPTPVYVPPPLVEKVETVAKNYIVHELSQREGVSKPLWKDTMAAMFGDHVRWEELKVYTGKGRPLSRPREICPITGQVALYRDPRTGVPFANLHAFQTLTKILSHEYVWSEGLGCYVSTRPKEDDDEMDGVASEGV